MQNNKKFLYLSIGSDSLSKNDKLMLPIFVAQLNYMCSKYGTKKAVVFPVTTSFKKVVAFVDPVEIDGKHVVPFASVFGGDEEYTKACANHEFVHIFFKENKERRRDVANAICPQLHDMVRNDKKFDKSLFDVMPYCHERLCVYMDESLDPIKRLSGAEDVICELATCEDSPVKKEIFDMIISGNWDANDLFYIFAKLSAL